MPVWSCRNNYNIVNYDNNKDKISYNIQLQLQYDWENREHLKYPWNVYCVVTNHSKDQDMRPSHKTTNVLMFLIVVQFSYNTLTFQKYFGVHSFPGLTVKL